MRSKIEKRDHLRLGHHVKNHELDSVKFGLDIQNKGNQRNIENAEVKGGDILNRVVEEGRNQIISSEEAHHLASQGWKAADLHIHTFYSYDVVPTREVDPLILYEKAKAAGLRFISFTDHDTMEAYDRIGWNREGIVNGVEVKILDRKRVGHTVHINVYTLNRKQFDQIQRIARKAQDIEMLIEYLQAEGLPFIYNHPFWREVGEKLNPTAVVDLAEKFPVLEYNFGRIKKLNLLTLELAARKKKAVVTGSDAHTGEIGRIFTLAQGQNFKEFFESIKNGQAVLVTEALTYSKLKNEIWRRLQMLLDRGRWVMEKEDLSLATGNYLADSLIKILADNKKAVVSIKKAILSLMAKFISSTGIPASLYLREQNLLACQIEQELGYIL